MDALRNNNLQLKVEFQIRKQKNNVGNTRYIIHGYCCFCTNYCYCWTICTTLSSLLLHACINAHLLLHTHQGGGGQLLAERIACFRRVTHSGSTPLHTPIHAHMCWNGAGMRRVSYFWFWSRTPPSTFRCTQVKVASECVKTHVTANLIFRIGFCDHEN